MFVIKEFPFDPRDYQLEARHDVNQAINDGEHPLLVMPTGTGKSKTSAMFISDQIKLGKKVYVIAPQIEIFDQLLKDYAFLNPGYINDEGFRGKDRNIYVCMALSLVNILSLIGQKDHPDVILVDECHHSAADTWESIYTYFFRAIRVGMTATPVRTDKKPLGHLYTVIIEPITIKEAMRRGFLTPPIVVSPEEYLLDIPLTDEVDEKKQAELLGEPQIVGEVLETYERVLNGLTTLFACCSYVHANNMRNVFREAGWRADHIHSGLSKDDRKGMLGRVQKGMTNALFTVGIGIEGFDCSNISALAYLRRTSSTTIFVQFNGRPMRLGENKKYCYILDFVGNCVIHGMPDRVRVWDLKEGEIVGDESDVSFQKCPDCGVMNSIDNIECHWCGADLTEEGKKEGTCRRCDSWKKGTCQKHQTFAPVFCPLWLYFVGCPEFKRRGRKLPRVVDGELIAVDTEGHIHDLDNDIKRKKEEIKQEMMREKEARETLEELPSFEKRKIISKGLFADGHRRSLFAEALRG
jgi:superfamily II DNA or RNA helicase